MSRLEQAFHNAAQQASSSRGGERRFCARYNGLLHQVVQSAHQVDHALAADPVVRR